MSNLHQRAVAVGLLLLAVGVGLSFAQPAEPVAAETLLPASSVAYVHIDGGLAHQAAWQQTAAYEALYQSGLMDVVAKLFADIQGGTGGAQGMAGQVGGVLQHVQQHGISLSVALDQEAGRPPRPWAILVVHDAAMYEPGVLQLALMASRGEIQFIQSEKQGRNVTHGAIPRTPGIELGWWAEGEHLVIVAGMQAVDAALEVAAGGANITTNPLWAQYAVADADFEVANVGWLDFQALLTTFGAMPVPESRNETHPAGVSISEAAKIAGLDSLKTIAGRSGYKDRALWSEMHVDAPVPRSGLLSLMDQDTMTIRDLPSLPAGSNGFSATSFDWTRAYDTILDVAKKIEALLPPSRQGQIDAGLAEARAKLGFDIRDDLLEPLGHVHCGYSDSNQAPLGLALGLIVSVDDADKLRSTVEKALALVAQESRGQAVVKHLDKHGHDVILLEVQEGGASPAMVIGDKWLAIGSLPQCVEAYLLRDSGELPRWQPDADMQAALAAVPEEFTAITVSDPRATYRLIAGLAPFGVGAAKAGLRQAQILPPDFELSISVADLPPAEVVIRPLFPNVSVAGVNNDGVTYTSRSSLAGIPLAGAFDGGTAVATTAVLTALLLPAVQQAREAARRTQSRNNLKQMMLAMHNYHDVNNHFPEGTYPNEKLEPDERLSWLATILPYLDQANLFNMIDFDAGWEDEENELVLRTRLPVYMNPSSSETLSDYGTTHYIGIAGVGEDGPTLPVTSKKAGVFAYDRSTGIRDIRDGTSNTLAITDSSEPSPWGAGGHATIRSLTEKPYINGPDGIGGPHQGGISAALCDGSVRFIGENIDPGVFEALTTINGGEVIGEF